MKKLLSLCLFIFVLFIIPIRVDANIEATIITANPGEDSSSMMNISWLMDSSKTKGKMVYTKKSDSEWKNSETVDGVKELVDIFRGKVFYHYYVELKDLDANTEYMYRVGQDSLSDIYHFKTGGLDAFNFLWVSDWHAYGPLPGRADRNAQVIRASLAIEPEIDFIFSTGDDLAYGSDYEAQKYVYDKDQYKSHMVSTTVGNHDVMHVVNGVYYDNTDEFFTSTHHHPQNGYAGQVGASYYFKYGPALFIVLNNEDINYGHSSKKVGLDKAQVWAKEVIVNNPSQYIFVAMHYQWFDGRNGKTNAQYTDWRNFFDENNVDLAMAGNNHVYLKTKGRIYNDEPSNTNNGTVYMQAPSSDGERGVQHGDIVNNAHIIEEMWSQGTNTIGTIIVNVTKEGVSHRLIDNAGRIRATGEFASRYKEYDFNKEEFLDKIEVHKVNNQNVITAPEEGIKFVERIEYYDEEELIGVNYFYQLKDTSFKLDNQNYFNLKAKVSFLDGTTKEINLINENYYNLENVSINLEDEQLKLSWDYDGLDDFNLYIYSEEELIKQVSVKDKSVLLGEHHLNKLFVVKPTINSKKTFYNVKYNNIGDGNFDQEINLEDVLLILDYLNKERELTAQQKLLLDIDDDGQITIVDLTYLHLYINKNSPITTKETYMVNFYDQFENLILSKEVYRGSDVIPPDLIVEGDFVFIGWDKNLNNISSNLNVLPILIR